MPIDERKYQRLKEILASGGEELSAESRSKAEAAVAEYDNAFMGRSANVTMPDYDAAKTQELIRRLDPSQPLQPQVLALQPGTGHPGGDEAAKQEWIRGDIDNPAGKVIVYDAPVAEVRQKLMENPQIFKSLGYDAPMSSEAVTSIQAGDSIHQAYNDWLWGQTADAAVKAGKTPYRYSKAPWLKSGNGASVLDTLSTKVKTSGLPAIETATAFVLGQDNTANFSAATAVGEAGLLDQKKPTAAEDAKVQEDFDKVRAAFGQTGPRQPPLKPREATVPGGVPVGGDKDEIVGSVSAASRGKSTAENLDMLREESPVAHGAGQVLGIAPGLPGLAVKGAGKAAATVAKLGGEAAEGAVRSAADAVESGVKGLAGWNPATKLWEWVTGAGAAAQSTSVLKNVGNAAAGAATHQGVTEAVRAGANYAGTGETGTTLGRAAMRTAGAAGGGAAFAGTPAVLQGGAKLASKGINKWVEQGRRYEGIPGRLRQLGTEFKFGKGPVPSPVVQQAREEAAARAGVGGVKPIDTIAEKMAGPLTAAVKSNTQTKKIDVSRAQEEVHQSVEGKALIPATNIVTTAVDILRKRMAPLRGRGVKTSVGVPNAELPAKRIFNANIEGVSLRPVEGAIPIKVSELGSFLNPVWQSRAARAASRPDKAFRRTSADKITIRQPDAPGRAAEAGADIEKAAEAGGLTKAPNGLARTSRYPGSRHPELEAKDLTVAGPGLAKGSRQPTAGERTGAELPKVTARNLGPEGSRWRRRGPKEQAAADNARKKRETAAGSYAEQLKARGIRTVYVMPRRYNSRHHESAVQMLRKRRDESATDRDLVKLYNAALKDRDTRTWQGAAGGWSALQRENERLIGAAKDTARRVAPNTPKGAYGRVVATAKQREGQSKDLTAMEQMAARAGVTEQLKGARSLDILEDLENRISLGRVKRGDVRSPLSPSGWFDAGTIKLAYPVTKAIEKAPGVGHHAGKAELLGDDPEASVGMRRKARDDKRKPAYEKATAKTKGGAGGFRKKKRRKKF